MPRHALPSLAPPPTHTRAHAAPCPPLLAACACYLAAHSIDQADWPFLLTKQLLLPRPPIPPLLHPCHISSQICSYQVVTHARELVSAAWHITPFTMPPGHITNKFIIIAAATYIPLMHSRHISSQICLYLGVKHARELVSAAWHITPFTVLPGYICNKIIHMAVAT